MELASLKSYQRTIASVDKPLLHFIETGFWNPFINGDWEEFDIGDSQVRRACRKVAQELKRPFIMCYANISNVIWQADTSAPLTNGGYEHHRVKLDKPKFNYGFVQIPKRKYLINLATPLLLASENPTKNAPVRQVSLESLWQFNIQSEELWNSYYAFVLNDPDCRKARGLTS